MRSEKRAPHTRHQQRHTRARFRLSSTLSARNPRHAHVYPREANTRRVKTDRPQNNGHGATTASARRIPRSAALHGRAHNRNTVFFAASPFVRGQAYGENGSDRRRSRDRSLIIGPARDVSRPDRSFLGRFRVTRAKFKLVVEKRTRSAKTFRFFRRAKIKITPIRFAPSEAKLLVSLRPIFFSFFSRKTFVRDTYSSAKSSV